MYVEGASKMMMEVLDMPYKMHVIWAWIVTLAVDGLLVLTYMQVLFLAWYPPQVSQIAQTQDLSAIAQDDGRQSAYNN